AGTGGTVVDEAEADGCFVRTKDPEIMEALPTRRNPERDVEGTPLDPVPARTERALEGDQLASEGRYGGRRHGSDLRDRPAGRAELEEDPGGDDHEDHDTDRRRGDAPVRALPVPTQQQAFVRGLGNRDTVADPFERRAGTIHDRPPVRSGGPREPARRVT